MARWISGGVCKRARYILRFIKLHLVEQHIQGHTNMKIESVYEVNVLGIIQTRNAQGLLQSFNGKPAIITPDGRLAWCESGRVVKEVDPSGRVLFDCI